MMYEYFKRFSRNYSFKGILNAFLHFKSIVSLPKADILFLCHDNSRTIIYENKLFSPLIDTLSIELESYSSLTLALPFSKFSGKKTFGNTYNLNLYILLALLKRFIKSRSLKYKNSEKDPVLLYYKRVIKRVSPRIIIGVQPSIELCVAAQYFNINVVDVQHGIIDTTDRLSYYSLVKRNQINQLGWPNYVFCRDKVSLEFVNNNLPSKVIPKVVGNLGRYFNINYLNNISNTFYSNVAKTVVLYTLQPFYSKKWTKENEHFGVIFSKRVYDLICEGNFFFIIKLHPSQLKNPEIKNKYFRAFRSMFKQIDNVDYINANNLSIEESIFHSNIHITFNSATTLDAMELGIKTIILDDNYSLMRSYFGVHLDSDYILIDPNLQLDLKSLSGHSKVQALEIDETNKPKLVQLISEVISNS